MLRLYYADVSAPEPASCALSAYRLEKLNRLRDPVKRRQSLCAELLLRYALFDAAPEQPWPPEIVAGEYGKPAWNVPGLHFNLSHSGRLAACVLSDRPVGLDVQEPCACRETLVRRFFSQEEREALQGAADRELAFGRIWALKESWIKAIGTGLATPLQSFSVAGEESVDAAFWYDYREGFHFALCLPGAENAEPDAIEQVDRFEF